MRIAYIGQTCGTSLHRAEALRRLGHQVSILDPWCWLGRSKWAARWQWHAAGIGAGALINRRIKACLAATRPDLVFVDQGEFLGPRLIRDIGRRDLPVVNYAIDDPFGPHGRIRFWQYRKALRYYTMAVVVRQCNVDDAARASARRVKLVMRSADEVAHAPRNVSSNVRARFASEVAFIGTWMSERGPFMAELIQRGVPLSIWGDNWSKAPEWPVIQQCWRGAGLTTSDDYSAAIQSAKVCLGLLSKGNRDLHTTRSLEIPSLGGLFCAERTPEHEELYVEGEEAVFWKDAVECAAVCKRLLSDESARRAIASRGHERALRNGHFNEPVLESILEAAVGSSHVQMPHARRAGGVAAGERQGL